MSWNVSASGGKAELHGAIDAQVRPEVAGDQAVEWERARIALHLLVDSMVSTESATLSAHGSATPELSVKIT